MIPKIIHYCWFGHNPLPVLSMRCIESWKKYCPNYKIQLWDESNFDIYSSYFVSEAYEEKEWAFASDYARLKIIYENGGIYLDTDVELLRSLDNLLDYSCFLGTEISAFSQINRGEKTDNKFYLKRDINNKKQHKKTDKWTGIVSTGLGFGAEKRNTIVKMMLDQYEGKHFRMGNGINDKTPCPKKNMNALKRIGYNYTENIWEHDGVIIFPPEYFSPMNYITGETKITENSYSIHHYSALWISDTDREMMKQLENIEHNNPKIIALIKKQLAIYKGLKKQGKALNFIGYLISRVRLKAISR